MTGNPEVLWSREMYMMKLSRSRGSTPVHEKPGIEAEMDFTGSCNQRRSWWAWPGSNRRPPACKDSPHEESSAGQRSLYGISAFTGAELDKRGRLTERPVAKT